MRQALLVKDRLVLTRTDDTPEDATSRQVIQVRNDRGQVYAGEVTIPYGVESSQTRTKMHGSVYLLETGASVPEPADTSVTSAATGDVIPQRRVSADTCSPPPDDDIRTVDVLNPNDPIFDLDASDLIVTQANPQQETLPQPDTTTMPAPATPPLQTGHTIRNFSSPNIAEPSIFAVPGAHPSFPRPFFQGTAVIPYTPTLKSGGPRTPCLAATKGLEPRTPFTYASDVDLPDALAPKSAGNRKKKDKGPLKMVTPDHRGAAVSSDVEEEISHGVAKARAEETPEQKVAREKTEAAAKKIAEKKAQRAKVKKRELLQADESTVKGRSSHTAPVIPEVVKDAPKKPRGRAKGKAEEAKAEAVKGLPKTRLPKAKTPPPKPTTPLPKSTTPPLKAKTPPPKPTTPPPKAKTPPPKSTTPPLKTPTREAILLEDLPEGSQTLDPDGTTPVVGTSKKKKTSSPMCDSSSTEVRLFCNRTARVREGDCDEPVQREAAPNTREAPAADRHPKRPRH